MKKRTTIKYLGVSLLLLSLGVLVFFISIPEALAKETYSNQEILQWKYNQKKKEAEIKYNIQKQKEVPQKKVETKKTTLPKKTIQKTKPLVTPKKVIQKKVTPKKETAPLVTKLPLPETSSEQKQKDSFSPQTKNITTPSFSLSNPNTNRYLVTYKKNETVKTTSTIHRLKKRLPLKRLNVEIIEATPAEVALLKQEGLTITPDVAMESTSIPEYNLSWGVRKIGAEQIHNLGIKGSGVKVAIIDSGIDYTHPEIAQYYKGGLDVTLVPSGTNPMDTWGHGTSVAGVIGSALNDSNGVGVSPQVELYALKAGDSGTIYASAAAYAMDWAITNGMHITNSSFGSKNPGVKVWLETVYQRAKDAGILNIVAVGNTGTCSGTLDPEPFYPASFSSVIAVGAVDEGNNRACFSRISNDIDISAPGTNIYSTYLNHEFGTFDGTSLATPHVVGAAALLWNLVPDINHNGRKNDEMESLLLSTASDFGPLGKDPLYGEGVVNVLNAYNNIPEETIEQNLLLNAYVDKNTLKQGVDIEATITVVIRNELNNPVSELNNAITVSNVSAVLTWSEEPQGHYTTKLPISALQIGQNILQITAQDTRGKTANQNITLTVIEKDPVVDPAINTTLSVNKNTFKKGEDTEAVLTLVIKDENNTSVTGLSSNIVPVAPSSISTITWTEETAGTYKATIPLETLSVQTHNITLLTTDSREITSTNTISFSLLERDPDPYPEKTLVMSLNSKKPLYTLYTRGRRGDQYITLRLIVKDEYGKAVNKIPRQNFIAKLNETGNPLTIFRATEVRRGTYDIKIDKDLLPASPTESTFHISLEVKDKREISADTDTEFSTLFKASVAKVISLNYTEPSTNSSLASVSQTIPNGGSAVNPIVVINDEFGRPIEGAKVTLRVMDGKKILGTKVAISGIDGKASATFILKKSGCFTTNVVKITKKGYAFTKGTPENTTCNPTSSN